MTEEFKVTYDSQIMASTGASPRKQSKMTTFSRPLVSCAMEEFVYLPSGTEGDVSVPVLSLPDI